MSEVISSFDRYRLGYIRETFIEYNRAYRVQTHRYYGNVTGKKFKTLMVREDNGVRVWRLSRVDIAYN